MLFASFFPIESLHDNIHVIATVKGFILPQFYCMKTHHRLNRMQIDIRHAQCSFHRNTALASASASLITSHWMYLAFWEHARQAEAVARTAKWCHTTCGCYQQKRAISALATAHASPQPACR
jgi:hypothetical protein